jgi:NADH dehydrogenase
LRVVVIDRGARIGAALGDGIRPSIEQASEALGVGWICGATVASVDPAGVLLDNGQRIDAGTVIWTVGFKANPLTEQIGERDHRGACTSMATSRSRVVIRCMPLETWLTPPVTNLATMR